MAAPNQSEDAPFADIREQVYKITQEVVENSLQKRVYSSKDVQNWVNVVADNVMRALTDYNKNFKYMVTSIIMQKSDSGLNVASTCYWNSQSDGYCTIKWENQSMFCIVNVFAVSL